MTPRSVLIDGFLDQSRWDHARREGIAGDASTRAYTRLTRSDGITAILMDSPPDELSVRPFLRVGAFLADNGFSTPEIYATDEPNGLLLLEDFGDGVFARLMDADPTRQEPLYRAAVDMLSQLADIRVPPDLLQFTPRRLASMVDPVFDWYLEGIGRPAHTAERQTMLEMLKANLAQTCFDKAVVSLRDCHAENLMWLPDRTGVKKIGLLDFQDAVVIHPAYDIVSLLQDVRRDIPKDLAGRMVDRYLTLTRLEEEAFRAAFAVLGLQRNLRILGIFARLAIKEGKPRYLAFMKRVWAHLEENMAHPSLHPLATQIRSVIPAPTEAALQQLAPNAGP